MEINELKEKYINLLQTLINAEPYFLALGEHFKKTADIQGMDLLIQLHDSLTPYNDQSQHSTL